MALPDLALQIGTNYIPSEEDIAQIKSSILPGPAAKLAELEIEIARVQELYSSLTKQRQDLLAEIDGYHSLISPARRLPIDILQEVFTHTLPTAHNAVMDTSECPMLLTRICRRWRSIAISTPHLWSTIHIPIPPVAGHYPRQWGSNYPDLPDDFRAAALSSLQKYSTIIINWLERSGVSPLSISLYDPRDSSIPKEHYGIIIDSIIPFANRWKNLVLDAHTPSLGRIAELTESDVPLLESITLHDITVNDWGVPSNNSQLLWKTSGIVKSHRLRKVEYTQRKENITHFSFRWAQLTDIKLFQTPYGPWGSPPNTSYITIHDLVIVLNLSPRLINFHSEIGFLTTDLDSPPSISVLPLPDLQKLVFHDGGANCKALFDLLEVPSLLHLEFFPTNHSSYPVLLTFLPQVSGTILSLTTSYAFFSKPEYNPLFTPCRNLTSMIIKTPPSLGPIAWSATFNLIDDTFLESLILPIDHPDRIAPALEVFECHVGGIFSDEAVLGFIKAKQSRADLASLTRISILFTRQMDLDVALDEEVAQCISNGLVVNLEYSIRLDPRVPFAYTPDAGIRLTDGRSVWPPSESWQ